MPLLISRWSQSRSIPRGLMSSEWPTSTKMGASMPPKEKLKVTQLRYPINPGKVVGSMGVYIFNADVLIPVLLIDAEDPKSTHDFGKDIIPKMVDDYRGGAGGRPRIRRRSRGAGLRCAGQNY